MSNKVKLTISSGDVRIMCFKGKIITIKKGVATEVEADNPVLEHPSIKEEKSVTVVRPKKKIDDIDAIMKEL